MALVTMKHRSLLEFASAGMMKKPGRRRVVTLCCSYQCLAVKESYPDLAADNRFLCRKFPNLCAFTIAHVIFYEENGLDPGDLYLKGRSVWGGIDQRQMKHRFRRHKVDSLTLEYFAVLITDYDFILSHN